jgi:Do/DeqQ family serine protease
MKRSWLLFSQAVTIAVAFWFVLATFQPHLVQTFVLPGLSIERGSSSVQPGSLPPSDLPQPSAGSLSAAALKAQPSVVSINTLQRQSARPFPRGAQDESGEGLGSGVIISKDGLILTNHHVVQGADAIEVVLHNGQSIDAEVVGTDPETDLALLRVKLPDLPAITLGDDKRTRVGDVVLAIGNPFGVGQTVTSGIISALGRNQLGINTFENFIQTDAAINPGNSGGALVDIDGRLLGINTAIYSRSGGSLGIGFAIPVSTAQEIVRSLLENGRVTRGWLGVEPIDMNAQVAKHFDLPFEDKETAVVLAGVMPAGPAARAGMKPGDAVLRINGTVVRSVPELLSAVAALRPGLAVPVTIRRSGKEMNLSVTPGERPAAKNQQRR